MDGNFIMNDDRADHRELRPFKGWALQAAREIEDLSGVSIIRHLFLADDLRRAAAFLVLAAWRTPGSHQHDLLSEVTPEDLAHWLLTEDALEISELFGWMSPRPRTLLGLIGRQPLARPEHYWIGYPLQ